MADFLLELLCEEIPARMQRRAREDLARLFVEHVTGAGLRPGAIETYATPRRLALIARDLPGETEAVEEERRGPRADAPQQAIEGFLKSTGLARDQVEEREDKKGRFLFAIVRRPGRDSADVVAEAIPAIVRAFPWPKSMRWGEQSVSTESLRWVRPLHGIVALLGEQIVDVEVAGIASSAATVGHRFHHPGVITIGSANDYAEKLQACHVIIDPAEREAIIREGAQEAAQAAGLSLIEDAGLVEENAGLTEWPVPLLGRFEPAFLEVPREVIQLTMRTNQKYFACTDPAGALAPSFVCVANIEAADGGAAIVAGNEKVLTARLSDAKFFWEQDLKVPLERQADRLGEIVFHEKLGTVADKVERVARLARWLVENDFVRGIDPTEVERAARLAKADLVSGMVGEFPELQGTIGGHLARAQKESDAVADAIRDHYKPVNQGDEVPIAPVTVAVSLAEKIDSLACFFEAKLQPTGSKDPFALRRAALGFIAIVTSLGLRLPLLPLLSVAVSLAGKAAMGSQGAQREAGLNRFFGSRLAVSRKRQGFEDPREDVVWDLLDFFADRLKVQQREAGVRHDLIDAVFALGGEDDLVRLLARVSALQSFVETSEGTDLLTGYKRAANILKKEGWTGDGTPGALCYVPEDQEAALIAALDLAGPRAEAAIAAEDFEAAMAALASLRGPVDAFFDTVTVNDADPAKREARLALLARMRTAVHRVADFSRIEG